MMLVFIAPFILRPLDAIENFMKYLIGLFAYLFMMPTFTNVMQIYAFCNLHDISWGNRPATSQGVEAVSANKKKQDELRLEYQVYRSNFVYLWIVANIGYMVFSVVLTSKRDPRTKNEGFGVLDFLALFIAFLVLFKVVCATIYVITWNIRFCRDKDYRRLDVSMPATNEEFVKAQKNYKDFEDQMQDVTNEEMNQDNRMRSIFSGIMHMQEEDS